MTLVKLLKLFILVNEKQFIKKEALKKMNITYRDLNDKEIAMPIGEFIRLVDEYTELKQQIIALQEVIANIIEINTEGK